MAQQRQFCLIIQTPSTVCFSTMIFCLSLLCCAILCRFWITNVADLSGAVIGLSYKDDHRPQQQHIEFWQEHVAPGKKIPQSDEWQRYKLHSAANLFHVEQKYHVSADEPLRYKVAWVGGCVMYDTEKLKDIGGFNFWKELPQNHCGEDVLAQICVMKRLAAVELYQVVFTTRKLKQRCLTEG